MGKKSQYKKPFIVAAALSSVIIAGVLIKLLLVKKVIKKREKEVEKPVMKSFQKAVFWTIVSGLIEALAKLAVHQTSMWAEKRL